MFYLQGKGYISKVGEEVLRVGTSPLIIGGGQESGLRSGTENVFGIKVFDFAGQEKYWPWFWLIFPVFSLVTPLSFGLSMIFDHKSLKEDCKKLKARFAKKEKTTVH